MRPADPILSYLRANCKANAMLLSNHHLWMRIESNLGDGHAIGAI
jgi:hypothetical protein